MSGRLSRSLGLSLLCTVCGALCLHHSIRAENSTFVPLKAWNEYTVHEKRILTGRWTQQKRRAVAYELESRRSVPEFVVKLAPVGVAGDSGFDLRGIQLGGRFLNEFDLAYHHLQGAELRGARLEHADLFRADLQGASLQQADLTQARLSEARLQGANLRAANLQRADLSGAHLQRAHLTEANLQDADLFGAYFDSTHLWEVNLGGARNIRYVVWGDRIKPRYIIGEEVAIHSAADSLGKEAYRRAEITYRDLKTLYQKERLIEIANEFHYRENEVTTKKYLRTLRRPLNYLWGLWRVVFLKWSYGYGTRPIWLLRYSIGISVLFALVFAGFTRSGKTRSGIYQVVVTNSRNGELVPISKGRVLLNCFYFSLLSFATIGYGALKPKQWLQWFRLEPVEYRPVRWARIFVGIEAALGIWVFALLVTVLFGK